MVSMSKVALVPVLVALSLVYVPSIWVYTALLVDFHTPWVLFESPMYEAYHQFLVSRLTEQPELPIPEIAAKDATYETVRALSNGYTFPIVIKGMLKDSEAVKVCVFHFSHSSHSTRLISTLTYLALTLLSSTLISHLNSTRLDSLPSLNSLTPSFPHFRLSLTLFPSLLSFSTLYPTPPQNWPNHDWWVENYSEAPLLCGTQKAVHENCTVGKFYDELHKGNPFYVSVQSSCFLFAFDFCLLSVCFLFAFAF
jgi:hypothetical protein